MGRWDRGAQRCARAAVALVAIAAGAGLLPQLARAETCPNAAFRTGDSAQLSDCRAYEQVSPGEKHSEDAYGEGALAHAAPTGGAVAYTSKNVFAESRGAGVVGSSRVDLQACKLEYSIVSPK